VTSVAPNTVHLGRPASGDAAAIAALNNIFAPDGLTLPRTEGFVEQHLADYQVARTADGTIVGCVALDEYSPALAELVSLAVHPSAQGHGLGKRLIQAAVTLATRRGHPMLFAVSFSDELFLSQGFLSSTIDRFPEKKARYAAISRSEIQLARKFCFERPLRAATAP
jgi:amino-acid N-acetyltransferase